MHFLTIDDLTPTELDSVLTSARDLKGDYDGTPLADTSLAMLFEKASTRTRVSFEVGMTKLGGHAVFLGKDDIQLGRGEPVQDTARALACYADAVMARVDDHETLETLASYSDIPVVNGLSDESHPVQTLADLLTVEEVVGEDASVAWVGDGNNVAASFVVGAAMRGHDVSVATPDAYALDGGVFDRASDYPGTVTATADPAEAVADADIVYTDVWVSMGDEDEREERLDALQPYQVNEELLVGTNAKVMHCLPAHRGEEITESVLESERAVVWRQAENRMHGQNGLLLELV
ncbi:ornithine carbamoyltransferase [Salarchaeum japonicum]|uniref:ornithine carbamoyltransferase n=1 Tax=Salarchaeum japonicum TaxID=555573 RepID=UPI003C72117A